MKGLLFTPQMARRAVAGYKTVTRRVITPPKPSGIGQEHIFPPSDNSDGKWYFRDAYYSDAEHGIGNYVRCPYGLPGERRCLLTTWMVARAFDRCKPRNLGLNKTLGFVWWLGLEEEKPAGMGKRRPGRFLPNHLRPLMPQFEIVSVRVERVQDITKEDVLDEGVQYPVSAETRGPLLRITGEFPPYQYCDKPPKEWTEDDWLRTHFASLWDSINHARGYGWAENPWVWRIEFRRVDTLPAVKDRDYGGVAA